MRPAERGARARDFLGAERRAVRVVMAAFVGAPWPMTVLQQISVGRRASARAARNARVDGRGVVAVRHGLDAPAVGAKRVRRVVGEPFLDVAVDGDAVVVVEDDQLSSPRRPASEATS